MNAPHWNGDEHREMSPPPTCDDCGAELYPEERQRGTCASCHHEALDNAEPGDPDGEDYCRDRDAEYRAEQDAAVRLK